MASANKPTAVHFSLVAFVMISAVCGFMWYMTAKDMSLAKQDLETAKKSDAENKAAAIKANNEAGVLKGFIGHNFELGAENADETNMTTVRGNVAADMQKYSPDARKDYTSALQKLASDLRDAKNERDDIMNNKLAVLTKDYLDLQSREAAKLAAMKVQVEKAEADLQSLIVKRDERLVAKQAEIKANADKVVEITGQLDAEKLARTKEVNGLKQILDAQTILITRLNEEMDGLKKTSFEVPKGIVRYVDHTGNLVWINLGRDDLLHPRTTFSIYVKSNQGMARSNEDIKGAIEVTRIIGPHLAEARITKSDIFRPIAAGDPIYTPLWSPAGTEKFAFAGIMDLDNDKYSDRESLIQKIKLSGAEVAAEVSEQGVRTGVVDQTIKFLVLGKIPKLDDADSKEQREQFLKMYKEIDTIRKEAKENGVRTVTLSDFANYIGYVRNTQLYRPGDKPVDQLNAGAHSNTLNADPGQRRSPGKVSNLFELKDKSKYKAPVSPGQTSKIFKGGR